MVLTMKPTNAPCPQWKIIFSETALKEMKKFPLQEKERLLNFLNKRVAPLQNPRDMGIATKGSLGGFWRYRVGNYRILVDIMDKEIMVYVLKVAHRKHVYNP